MSMKRKTLTIDEKVQILKELDSGLKNSDICKKYNLSSSTVSTILKNKEKFVSATCRNECKKLKTCVKADLDAALIKWFQAQRSANFPISGPILKIQAEKFAERFGYKDFICSTGWLDRFKQRHEITFGKMSGEAASVNKSDATKWIDEKWPEWKMSFEEDNIYNADETGVFFNATPRETLKFKGEKCVGGKLSKLRLTALVCANMSGKDKRKLLVIGKSKKPRCFKNVRSLPTHYESSSKAWMTADIFQKAIKKWDNELASQNRKILLLVDNCSAHPDIPVLKNIQMEFLPPNTTSVLQPMDQGVIRSLKCHYRKQLILMLLDKRERGTDSTQNVSIIEAIRLLDDAWNKVSQTCVQNAFKRSGFKDVSSVAEMVEEEEGMILDEAIESTGVSEEEFRNYVDVDDALLTAEMPTEESIIAEVNGAQPHNLDDEGSEDEEIEPPPSISEATECMRKLQTFLESRVVDEDVFRAMALLRRTIAAEKEKERVQTKITGFFNVHVL